MPSPSPIASLPSELVLEVTEYLPPHALSALCRTCRYYRSICDPILTDYLFKNKDRIIHRAAVSNRPHIISHLFKRGVSLDFPEVDAGLLSDVAKRGYSEVMRALLDAGANPNSVDSRGKTLLYYAVAYRRLEVALRLVEKGAEANRAVYDVLHETQDDVMKGLLRKHGLYHGRCLYL